MGYSPNMMNIDPERLRNFAAKNGGLKHISLQLGYSRSYLSNVADYGRMRLSVGRQLSAMYGVPEDFFRAREPEKPKAAAPQAGQAGAGASAAPKMQESDEISGIKADEHPIAAKAREASANAAQPGGGAVIKGGSKA